MEYLGAKALGSRLKRLSENMMREVAQVYEDNDIEFEPKWFPTVQLLLKHEMLAIKEIAEELDVTHSSISQILTGMKKKGFIEEMNSDKDNRIKLMKLTKKAKEQAHALQPMWSDFGSVIEEIEQHSGLQFVNALSEFELSFKDKGIRERMKNKTQQRLLDEVKIIDYSEEHAEVFKNLNYEWLEEYFVVESEDKKVLTNPKGYILDRGGLILMAEYQNDIVGTVALIHEGNGVYEIAKMAVSTKCRGKQIGKKLMQAILEKASELKPKTVYLVSNRKLIPALNLYRKFGFKVTPLDPNTPYERCDIRMEIDL
ncbi:MAG: bifunctional helix-turn-helix transcriptional regulator/GNAT family N-acetyltransferase [Flavobacteriales bacterium]|nr:bifunctional helix-turn-helix transcriptional regulator/GNAT family N-acetyltransferase [Flavobacteriales bacterium]